ncbi:EpsG family protein [Metabacillus sp. 113a]|uniref:EpsG family protein n=1 Tax=Metabacillus sp. 113a TaxID=3404706 RepID=UPI003CF021D8
MFVYLFLPLIIVYFLFISRTMVIRSSKFDNNEIFVDKNNITLYIWFVILLSLAAFKGIEVGSDYPMYYNFFVNQSYGGIELGVQFIFNLVAQFNSFVIFSFVVYFIFLNFIFQGIKKNTPNYLISVLVLILSYTYFASYNQIRQMIAVSLIFCFVEYLVTNNRFDKIKFLLIIFIAFLFHTSAIFLLVLLLIPSKKINPRFVIPLFLLTIFLYFIPEFKNQAGEIISYFSGFYGEKYSGREAFFFGVNKEKGLLQLLPVIIQMIIVVFSLYFSRYKDSININNKLYNLSTNIVVVNLCLYSLAGIEAIDRIQVYFSCFNIYFYSILLHLLFNHDKKTYGFLMAVLIIAFLLLYFTLRLINNIHGIVPYTLFEF